MPDKEDRSPSPLREGFGSFLAYAGIALVVLAALVGAKACLMADSDVVAVVKTICGGAP